ncbi:hypothetical protein BDV41DRAFT_536408 [Aspergillus transmontanensis]|uniref:Uncharacterized protein n=1 Tax=Aspergillus transmontanensis TaxID=1034304 RepID=A0A5N6W2M6_9EURO|nr:hypothetical protein BDV41DRAFT_536408 [Aspergillus transmontanensis]
MESLSQEVLLLTIPHLCRSSLEALNLTRSCLISPVLFNGTAPFPYLQNLNIDAVMLTYDGRWYYTGDYSSMNCHLQYSAEDTERGEAMLNGQEPHHLWRTEPDPEMFGALVKSMAEGMNRMPRLLLLEFCMAMHPTGDHGILFMYSEA